MATLEIISATTNIIMAIAAIAGARFAWIGLKTWQTQLKAENEHDIAKRTLQHLYTYRNALRQAWKEGGMYVRLASFSENKYSEAQYNRTAELLSERMSKLSQTQAELESILAECEAYWGDELNSLCEKLFLVQETYWTEQLHFLANYHPSEKGVRRAFETSEFENELVNAMQKIEEFLKPKILKH